MKSITLWLSYVGKNAPSNAAGPRSALGRTKPEALAAASHWANQAPFAKLKRITMTDNGVPPLSLCPDAEEQRVVDEITAFDLDPTSNTHERVQPIRALLDLGLYASAWCALHPEKTGRPPRGAERNATRFVGVRLSEQEQKTATELADRHGVTLSEWIRRRATTTGAER